MENKFAKLKKSFGVILIGIIALIFVDLIFSGGMAYSYILKMAGLPDWVALYSFIGLAIAYVFGEVYLAIWGNKASANEIEPPKKEQD